MTYDVVIGLEVHAQLNTKTKLFCRCTNRFGQEANTQTCPVCLGFPGALPVLNQSAIEKAILSALAVKAKINSPSVFSRKNYFYPDLPKGYQISQFDKPLCTGGFIEVERDGKPTAIRLERIHVEEDAGKLLHDDSVLTSDGSLIDLNRAGVPLIEIVSQPDLKTAEEAGSYLRNLRSILRYVGTCDGNMEEGSLRCDANVSLKPAGAEKLGTKIEVKNLNSFKNVEKAIEHEIARQTALLDQGETLYQETRLFNPQRGTTTAMRSKEEANDYRYFPEPDLPPLVVPEGWIAELQDKLPELPKARKQRFQEAFGLPEYDAGVLTAEQALADYYENALAHLGKSDEKTAKRASNLIMSEVLRLANDRGESIQTIQITPQRLANLMDLIGNGQISGKIAKDVIDLMAETGKDAQAIVDEKGWGQISDASELKGMIQTILADNPQQVESYKNGKDKLFGFFVGQVMKASKGQANPDMVNQLLKEALK